MFKSQIAERESRRESLGRDNNNNKKKKGEEKSKKMIRKGVRSVAAGFASTNEIGRAIGGCLLAFDVRLVKCTG